jgi:photosystem II stability/assembly factor-like uncharacterized protein
MNAFTRIARGSAGRAALAATLLFVGLSALAQTPASGPKLKGIWEPVNYGEDLSLREVLFVTPDIGYVAGEAGTILKTTDAGATWTALLGGDPQSQERAIEHLWFVTPTVGWATQVTSSHTNLFHTTDGELWTNMGKMPEHHEDVAFATETDGVFVDSKKIFRTQNAGKTWSEVYECVARAEVDGLMRQIQCNFWKVRFASPKVVYALGAAIGADAAVIAKSTDGGAGWSVVAVLANENGTEGGLFFLDENTGYVAMKDAKAAYRTTDGGVTWTGMPATAIARRIQFADPSVGWAMRYNTLSYTTDGGKRWASREFNFPAMENAFSLPRRDRAYVVGEHGMIYRYSVVPEATAISAKAIAAPAMPALDNAVLAQIDKLETGLDKIDAALDAAGSAGGASAPAGDWSSASVDQQLAQMQSTIDSVASGVPAMGSKHRNLNLVMFGLKLLGDLTGQGNGLKEAFASLRQSQDLGAASAALQSLHGQLDAMKTSVDTFQSVRKPGG